MIKSYSKINFSLRVIGKLKDGMHNIQSNFFLINYYDEIRIKRVNDKKDKFCKALINLISFLTCFKSLIV